MFVFAAILSAFKWMVGNWKLTLLAILVAWVGWLYWDRNHLAHKVQDLNLTLAKIEQQDQTLKDSSAALTRSYSDLLSNKWKTEKDLATSEQKRIQDDKILRSYRLPSVAVRVFNGASPPDTTQSTPNTQQANASGTSGSSPVVIAKSNPDSDKTLADLLSVSNENRHRLEMAIDMVHAWQNFWKDYVASVIASSTPTPTN